jgi:pyruvate, water dikinase
VLRAMHEVFASLFNDRAIAYRVHQGFDHSLVALSVGVQHMVRSDLGASGVMFTLDTDSGFRDVVFITASYGLGETVVQGAVNPDEFYVYKPALRAGAGAVLRRNLGSKAIKMVYADRAPAPRRDRRRPPPTGALLDHRRRPRRAREAGPADRGALRQPMDIEWGKDGATGEIYILQARPETVQSRAAARSSASR